MVTYFFSTSSHLAKVSVTEFMRVAWGPSILYLAPAWHSGEWAGSPRVHVTDMKGSGEDVESILRPVTSFSMTAFIVGQGLTKREGCTDRLAMALWLPSGTRMKPLETLSDYAGAMGPGFLLVHVASCSESMQKVLGGGKNRYHACTDPNPTGHLWDIMFRSIWCCQVAPQTPPGAQWCPRRRSSRTPSIVSLGAYPTLSGMHTSRWGPY